jgi:3'-phosphoadenosine 5'-phosphosulfate sulfotransferase (PAPS reductase)/FAD synthetase
MLDFVVEKSDCLGIRARIVVLHCDLGLSPKGHPIEWPGTKELAQEHAEHYGLRFIVVQRKVRGFLEEIEKRGMFPSSGQRYCTSYYKRDTAATAITALAGEAGPVRAGSGQSPRILQCFGFRAQESPRRRKMQPFYVDKRLSTSRKHVDVWLPIHTWLVEDVWARIRQAGTRHHYAYDKGMTRLSCRFCIFAPRSQLIVSGRENPELLAEYVELEKRIGHTFRVKQSLAEIQEAIAAGEVPGADDGAWNM